VTTAMPVRIRRGSGPCAAVDSVARAADPPTPDGSLPFAV